MTHYRRIHMEARDPALNRFRRWELEAAEDLFGAWIVRVRFGRIGSAGRTLVRGFADPVTTGRYVRAAIARRRSAPRRIGVAYRVITDDGTLA